MDWNNPNPEELEWVKIKLSGPHHDFSCTLRSECTTSQEKYATHYVRFGIVGLERNECDGSWYFYSCKECIADAYWEVNETDVEKST
jgi:hypothetical protein